MTALLLSARARIDSLPLLLLVALSAAASCGGDRHITPSRGAPAAHVSDLLDVVPPDVRGVLRVDAKRLLSGSSGASVAALYSGRGSDAATVVPFATITELGDLQ